MFRRTSVVQPVYQVSTLEEGAHESYSMLFRNGKVKVSMQRNFTPTFYGLSVKITYKNGLVTSFTEVHYLASLQISHSRSHRQCKNVSWNNIVFSYKLIFKLITLHVNLQIPICCMLVQLLEI